METQLVFLEDSQSYFQEIFVSLNLSVAMTVSFIFKFVKWTLGQQHQCGNHIGQQSLLQGRSSYGKMLKRMWNGDLTYEDQKQINTRVIGYQGLKLPTTF